MTDKRSFAGADAVFIGWMKTRAGDAVPLFTIVLENHPSFGSTVTWQTLRRLHLHIPPVPDPDGSFLIAR